MIQLRKHEIEFCPEDCWVGGAIVSLVSSLVCHVSGYNESIYKNFGMHLCQYAFFYITAYFLFDEGIQE